MIYRDFKFDKIDFYKKKLTKLQHSLKTFVKCYTIRDFELKENNHFVYKKSYKVQSVKIDDEKEYSGKFEILEGKEIGKIILRLII